jgi:hypothetical protein
MALGMGDPDMLAVLGSQRCDGPSVCNAVVLMTNDIGQAIQCLMMLELHNEQRLLTIESSESRLRYSRFELSETFFDLYDH